MSYVSKPRRQPTVVFAALIGLVVQAIFAFVVANQATRLPDVIWAYGSGSRGSAATVSLTTISSVLVVMWIGLGIYAVLTVVFSTLAFVRGHNWGRATIPSAVITISAFVGWFAVSQAIVDIEPQLSRVPTGSAAALAELTTSSEHYGVGLVVIALAVVAVGYLLARYVPQRAPETKKKSPAAKQPPE